MVKSNLFGILMMLIHAVALAALYAVVKLMSKDISSNIIVFLYKFTILLCTIPWCLGNGFSGFKTNRLPLHLCRGFFSTCGSLSMFYAIKHIALSDVTAVAYIEHMLLLLIGIFYFKENANPAKFMVILLSFIGALLIINPNYLLNLIGIRTFSGTFNYYYIYVFMAIIFWALNSTIIKILGKTEKTKVQLFYVMLFASIISFPIAFMDWVVLMDLRFIEIKYPTSLIDFSQIPLTSKHFTYIAVLASCYFLHVVSHFKALKYAELSVVVPFEYTRLVFTGVLGYIFFKEVPAAHSYYGYMLIIASGLYLFTQEHRKHKKLVNELQAQPA